MTHDVAYNSLLTERRRLLHEHAAQAIEALYPERLEDQLPELAHHFERSGNVPEGGGIPGPRRSQGRTANGACRGHRLLHQGARIAATITRWRRP